VRAVGHSAKSGGERTSGSRFATSGKPLYDLEHVGGRLADSTSEMYSAVPLTLLQRVAKKEPEAMRECVARFGGLVWSLARRAGLTESECEDVSQEIFSELWSVCSRYDPDVAGETAFVATIARRRIIDRQRRLGAQRGMIAGAAAQAQANGYEGAPPSKPGEVAEEATKAMKAFTLLSSDQQRVLRMSVELGLTHELIAKSTGMPLGTVKTHARRGLMKLRELLGEDEPDSSEVNR